MVSFYWIFRLARFRSGSWTKLSSADISTLSTFSGIALALLITFFLGLPDSRGEILNGWFRTNLVASEIVEMDHEQIVGEKSIISVRLNNHSDKPILIVGESKSCNCLTVDLSNRLIPPNGNLDLEIAIVPKAEGFYRQRIIYYLDSDCQSLVVVELGGNAKAAVKGKGD